MFNKLKSMWSLIIDPKYNPLAKLPVALQFQVTTMLCIMWSMIFCTMLQIYYLVPQFVVGHIVFVALGCYVTNYTWNNYKPTHRDLMRSQDKTYALYDDYWGS